MSHPFGFFYLNTAGASWECQSQNFTDGATARKGSSFLTCFFKFNLILVQLTVVAVLSIGPLLEPGSAGANAQMIIVGCLQTGFGTFIAVRQPCNDRLCNYIMLAQFLGEGSATWALFAVSFANRNMRNTLQLAAVSQLFFAQVCPILLILYDYFLVPAYSNFTLKALRRERITLARFGHILRQLLRSLMTGKFFRR